METFNRDIHPLAEYVELHPALKPLICNELVATAFDVHEAAAVRYKWWYNRLGLVSLVCIALVMSTITYSLSLAHLYGRAPLLDQAAALVGGLALLAQLLLIFGKFKERWLSERFAAERLRCIKFQAFGAIAGIDDPVELAAKVHEYSRDAIAVLSQDLRGGRAAIELFNPETTRVSPALEGYAGASALLSDAESVYDQLRFAVQEQHFENAARRELHRNRAPALIAELSFLGGGALACSAVVFIGINQSNPAAWPWVEAWLHFGTLLMFTLSAILAVYNRGAARQVHAERYDRYAREVRTLRAMIPHASPATFANSVVRMERIELRELQEFWRESERTSFIL